MNPDTKLCLSAANSSGRRIMALRLSEDMLKTLQNQTGNTMKIKFGADQTISIGSASFKFDKVDELQRVQIYKKESPNSELDFVGEMSHRLAVQRKFPEKSHSRSTSVKSQKTESEPFLDVINGPNRCVEQIIPLKTRILQMLALRAMGQAQIAMAVKKPKDELIKALNQVGTVSGGIWSLKPELYKEVQIEGWSLYTKEQREIVSRNVQEALGNALTSKTGRASPLLEKEVHLSVNSTEPQVTPADTRKRYEESPISVDDEQISVRNPIFAAPEGIKHRSAIRSNELQRTTKTCRNTSTPLKKARVVKETPSIYNIMIPKRSLMVREKTASIRKAKSFRIPAVKTASDYQDLTALFRVKYSNYIRLNEKLSKRRPIFEKLNEQLQTAIGTPQESELKRKIDIELAKHNANEVTKWAKQYCSLHQELEAIKKELWRAYEEGCMN